MFDAIVEQDPQLRVNHGMAMTIPEVTAARSNARRRSMPNLKPLHWLELAVALAVIIAITPALIGRLARTGIPDFASLLPSLAITDSVAAHLIAEPLWGPKQGDGEGELAPTARAIRLGAAIGSYEILQERGDPSAREAALGIASMLEAYPGGIDAGYAYRTLATRTPGDSAISTAAWLAERLAGGRTAQLGAWLQGARFAAASSDTGWFNVRSGRAIARSALVVDDRADTEMAARQFERVVAVRPHDFSAIRTAVEELLHLLGTR